MNKFVVVPGKKFYFFNEINDNEVFVEEELYLSCKNRFLANIQRISKKLGIYHLYGLFLKSWRNKLIDSDVCVIFDQASSTALIKSIKKINPNIRIIIYFWNPIEKNIKIFNELKKVKDYVEVYSFDKSDCLKYSVKFSPMIYNFIFDKTYDNVNYKYDVIFVGYLKSRERILVEIYNLLNKNDNMFFYVINNVNCKKNLPFKLQYDYLDYNEYKENMLKSKVVLDIVQDNQVGLTIRTLETICFNRKLITNNKDIVNYDFYSKDNIFIIGVDNINEIGDFINRPYSKIDNEILKKYNFTDWVKSF